MVKFNKSHLQMIVTQMEKHDWTFGNKNRYSTYFDKCAAIFEPDIRQQLNEVLMEFQQKWEFRLLTCEKIMFNAFQNWKGDAIKKKQYYTKIIGGVRTKTWKQVSVDPQGIEMDLRKIKLWCELHIIRICKDHELNFEELVKIGEQ